MISLTGGYALRILGHLADRREEWLQSQAVAAATGIPANYLSKILNQLRKCGLVESRKGWGGGFRIRRRALGAPIVEVLDRIEGPHENTRCVRVARLRRRGALSSARSLGARAERVLRDDPCGDHRRPARDGAHSPPPPGAPPTRPGRRASPRRRATVPSGDGRFAAGNSPARAAPLTVCGTGGAAHAAAGVTRDMEMP